MKFELHVDGVTEASSKTPLIFLRVSYLTFLDVSRNARRLIGFLGLLNIHVDFCMEILYIDTTISQC